MVIETETDDLASFEKLLKERGGRQDVQDAMAGYMDGFESGYREIFRVVE